MEGVELRNSQQMRSVAELEKDGADPSDLGAKANKDIVSSISRNN